MRSSKVSDDHKKPSVFNLSALIGQCPIQTENPESVLQQLAAREGIDVTSLYIEDGVVFKRKDGVVAGTVCQIGTPYWNAAKAAAEVLTRLRGR
jgi:hypothetical protein